MSVFGKRSGDVHLTSGEDGALRVRIDPATDVSGDGFRPTFLMERVSRYLEIQTDPVSRNQIEQAVEGKASAVRVAVDRLVQEGFVERTSGKRGSILHTHRKPFRESDP